MRLARIEAWPLTVPLTRPYAIAYAETDTVEMVAVALTAEDGTTGLGTGTPEAAVTGETFAACQAALAPEATRWLRGEDLDHLTRTLHALGERMASVPAARAALDIALHDLWAKRRGRPLVDLLGRCHDALPTSVTIGIKDVAATLAEAEEYRGRGFRVLKVKLGGAFDLDVERLHRLRERFPDAVLRTDANQAWDLATLRRHLAAVRTLGIEIVEQPLSAHAILEARALDPADRARLVADESLLGEQDALRLAAEPAPCGVFNVKLMKCGGIRAALGLARIAEAAGIGVMWGCMDESVVGIAAALHAAFASPATRFLDLDGSLDLASDVASGGFSLKDGILRPLDLPGLGVFRHAHAGSV